MFTRLYRLFFTLFIIIILTPVDVAAQEIRYRVEVLVLTHLSHDTEPREYINLDDYSQSIDFLTPPPPPEEEPEELPDESLIAEDEAMEEGAEEEAPRLFHVEEMSELMKENWRRLRLSAPFRPQQFLAWEQSADEPFPALRMHNLEVVLVEDPYAEQRALLEEQQASEAPVEETGDMADEEPGLPDPTVYYQLDGTITLRRSRFLHLDLQLDWREPQFALPDTDSPDFGESDPLPESFLVHRLAQSRQVKTSQLEYFDHPVLGVLAYITRIEVSAEE